MSYEIEPDRTRTFLFPPALDDLVAADHPARFIAEFVDSLDLQSMKIKVGHAPKGRPRYSARLLLGVFCYCYFSRIRSLREMERACLENVAVMWLTGMEAPDHNTLWRFSRDNREQLRGLLKESVRVAAELDLVGMVLHAVDGTKIQAQASLKTGFFRSSLNEVLARAEESIQAMLEGIEASAGLDGYRLPAELADAQGRKERIASKLKRLDEAETNSLNPHDPDARIMKCDGKKVFSYNAQAVADDRAGIVVGADVVTNETDHGLLVGMIEKANETTDSAVEETVADNGYFSGEELAKAEEKEHQVLVNLTDQVAPPENDKPFHASRFTYDPERDCCVCPIGGILKYQRSYVDRGETVSIYHCTGYKECPMRKRCSSAKRGRTIKLSANRLAVERQRLKQRDPAAKSKLARRRVIVEPVFSVIKDALGFRRWSVRGLEAVRTQWAIMCTMVNLHKTYRAWKEGVEAAA